jgi:competence protein ComEA
VAACLALSGWQVWRGREPIPVTVQSLAPPAGEGAQIKVQVAGAVAQPGVYRLTQGDRVEDAVRAAGGFTAEADSARVNLAQRLRDEERLDVPARGAPEGPPGGSRPPPDDPLAGRTIPAADRLTPPAGQPAKIMGKLGVNTATAAELEAVPGIGPVMARRIVTYRSANGPLRSLDDLRAAGIPEPLLLRAAGHLTFD